MLLAQHRFTIQLTSSGRFVPWMGPAFRGLVAKQLKELVCIYPKPERDARWTYCKGCPHVHSCIYGSQFEPEPDQDVIYLSGRTDRIRTIVIAPRFPFPPVGRVGDQFEVTIRLIGDSPAGTLHEIQRALEIVGSYRGLGNDQVQFVIKNINASTAYHLSPTSLPGHHASLPGEYRQVTVHLQSPLFVPSQGPPVFSDLFRASLRSISELFKVTGQPLEADYYQLKKQSLLVPTLQQHFTPFQQARVSNRQQQRYMAEGWIGHGTFGPVPASLLPWIYWAGQLHVGSNRVAGAGSWIVQLA